MSIVVMTRCRVDDFRTWKPKFDAFASSQPAIQSYRIWQGIDDPNLVVLMETWESREAADALLNHPSLEELMAADGVDVSTVSFDLIDEIT
jgi:quinol monooxygenase YgiN